jgi:hypothetical protein
VSSYRAIVTSAWFGTPVIQARTGWSAMSTSQAKQEPERQPVGIETPARLATFNNGSPASASTTILSGENLTLTNIAFNELDSHWP